MCWSQDYEMPPTLAAVGPLQVTLATASHACGRQQQVTVGRCKCASDGGLRGVTGAAASLNDGKPASCSGRS